jgi:signal transduction histidine kinase
MAIRINQLIIGLLLFTCQFSLGNTPIKLSAETSSINLWPHISYFADTSAKLTLEDIQQARYDSLFKPGAEIQNTFGYTPAAIWLKFSVRSDQISYTNLLILERTTLYDAIVYQVTEHGQIRLDSIGINVPYYSRPYPSNYSVLPLAFSEPHETIHFYLRLRTNTSMFIPIYIKSDKAYHDQISSINLFYGCYIGFLLILIAYNVVMLFLRKKSIYFWYLLYIIALLLYQGLRNSGLGYQYFYSDWPAFNSLSTFSAILIITMIQFSSQFLNAKELNPKFRWVSAFFMIIFGVYLLLNILDYSEIIMTYYSSTIWIVFIYLAYLGIYALYKGHPFARLYLIGWGAFILFYVLFSLWLNGYIGESFWGHRALYIGSTLEMIFWFSAVADKLSYTEKEKTKEKEKMKKEISRDFHDELGNQIARLINYISLLKIKSNLSDDVYEVINGYAQRILLGAKDFVWALDPTNDELSNLAIHLKDFGEKMFSEKKIEFRYYGDIPTSLPLPMGYSRQINFIFKEAMTNAFRHSQATHVEFIVQSESAKRITMCLKDDGIGISGKDIETSLRGFSNMRVRASRVKGQLAIENTQPGTSVNLTIQMDDALQGENF